MKNLTIEWKHYDKQGKTCIRCTDTGKSLRQLFTEIGDLPELKDVKISFIETKLSENQMSESNSLLLNGVPIEDLIGATISHNACDSCSDLADSDCYCRAVTVENITYESIPVELIKKAVLKVLNAPDSNKLKGVNMNIQVLGSGCPTCKKLHEITKQAVKELNLSVEVDYITDVTKIIEMGVMSSPVLAVNGKPVMVGFTPDIDKIKGAISMGIINSNTSGGCSCGGNC